jgi:hypothetical protein
MVARGSDVLTDPAHCGRSLIEMAHLHLPAEHSDQDLEIAGAIARALHSEDLYITWTSEVGSGRPIIPASIRDDCEPRRRRGLGALLGALRRRAS